MGINNIVEQIKTHANENYQVDESFLPELLDAASHPPTMQRRILGLKRQGMPQALHRVVLVAEVGDINDLWLIVHWAANIRQNLQDPQSSDLYLFILPAEGVFTIDKCFEIECSDLICRKYVLRPEETHEALLQRSFFGATTASASSAVIVDPFQKALQDTARNNPWLTLDYLDAWKQALLSAETGTELAHLLFNPINTSSNDPTAAN